MIPAIAEAEKVKLLILKTIKNLKGDQNGRDQKNGILYLW